MIRRAYSFVLAFIALAVTAVSISSCRENIIIQSDLTPGTDGIGTDTLLLPDTFFTVKTVYDDSILTSNSGATYSIYHAIGWMNGDVYSGRTSGNTYIQVIPTVTKFQFATTDSANIDSMVLVIPYSGFTWGDTTVRSQQTITAHYITDTLSSTSRYYSFTKKGWDPTEIGRGTFFTGPTGTGVIQDKVLLNKGGKADTVAAHLRIKMSAQFVATLKELIRDTSKTSSFATFLTNFKGIYLQADSLTGANPGKAMPYFRINGPASLYGQANLLVYAHNTNTDTVVYQLPFNNTYTAAYNRITRAYTDPSVFSPTSDMLLVQNQPGGAIDFTIKNLRNLPLPPGVKITDIVINRASIIFTEIPATISDKYTHPPRIYPIGYDGSGTKYGILDRYPLTTDDGLNFIDATPRTTNGITTYTMNLPREFQQAIVQQKSELHLRINGTQNYPAAYRLLVGNKNNASNRFMFRIIYSKQK